MKTILLFLVALLLTAFVPAPAVTDAILEWGPDSVICGTAGYDTIKAANDSSTIMAATAKVKGDNINAGGWTYYLQLGRITGTSKDTSNLCVAVDGYTWDDSLIGRVRSDTSADRSETYMFALPINAGTGAGGDLFTADKYRLKIMNVGTGTTTEQTILNQIILRKCRAINFNRNK